MACIHRGFNDDDGWGGCIHCENEEKHRIPYNENHQRNYNCQSTDKVSNFVADPYYYHRKLKKCNIISVDPIFTTIEYKGTKISLPNKIIMYKQGKKIKVYAHKRICNEILHKNGLPLLQ